jgi:cytochrome P450
MKNELSTGRDSDSEIKRPPHVPPERVVDFDVYHPPSIEIDFHSAWKTLHARGLPDLVWTPRNGGHWIATRARVIEAIFPDYETFSNRIITVPKSEAEQFNLPPSNIDPPKHRQYRNLLNSSLGPRAVGEMEEAIRNLAVSLIEKVRPNGQCNFTTSYAEVLPIQFFMKLMALPSEDTTKLKQLSNQIQRPDGSIGAADAIGRLVNYLDPYFDKRVGGDGDDLISHIANSQVSGAPISRKDAVNMSVIVLLGGLDTVVNSLSFIFLFLARNPVHRSSLIGDRTLIPAAMEEMLRRFAIVTSGREVTRDVVYKGVSLKKGDVISLPTALFGLDEQVNESPLEVNFDRSKVEHLAFGNGVHKCPGANLARAELRISLEEWLARIPEFSVAPSAHITFTAGITGAVNSLPFVWDVGATHSKS